MYIEKPLNELENDSDGLLETAPENITAYLIDINGMLSVEIDKNDFLTQAYKLLDCRNIAMIEVELSNGEYVDLVVDEEILLTRGVKLVTYSDCYDQPILGSFIVVCANSEGETISAPIDFKESMIVTRKMLCNI